jgi:SAM-dependent methyltransferase
MKQTWPAPERNKEPILEVLARVFPRTGRALEIASGSGQHAVHFARAFPELEWLPSDLDPDNLVSIRAWVQEAELPNLREPMRLDVTDADWGMPEGSLDAVFNANMIHIAPWACCLGLLRGVGQGLRPGGIFVLYGPFRVAGTHTSESNERFDEGLRARDASWGVRDLEAVVEQAAQHRLTLEQRVQMPANNQSLVFRRT